MDNNSNNHNVHNIDAMGRGRLHHVYSARSEPSIASLLVPPSGEVTERINELQSELATHTYELGDVRANYDRALVELAHAAREIDELRDELSR